MQRKDRRIDTSKRSKGSNNRRIERVERAHRSTEGGGYIDRLHRLIGGGEGERAHVERQRVDGPNTRPHARAIVSVRPGGCPSAPPPLALARDSRARGVARAGARGESVRGEFARVTSLALALARVAGRLTRDPRRARTSESPVQRGSNDAERVVWGLQGFPEFVCARFSRCARARAREHLGITPEERARRATAALSVHGIGGGDAR